MKKILLFFTMSVLICSCVDTDDFLKKDDLDVKKDTVYVHTTSKDTVYVQSADKKDTDRVTREVMNVVYVADNDTSISYRFYTNHSYSADTKLELEMILNKKIVERIDITKYSQFIRVFKKPYNTNTTKPIDMLSRIKITQKQGTVSYTTAVPFSIPYAPVVTPHFFMGYSQHNSSKIIYNFEDKTITTAKYEKIEWLVKSVTPGVIYKADLADQRFFSFSFNRHPTLNVKYKVVMRITALNGKFFYKEREVTIPKR